MSKVIAGILLILIGLALLAGGITSIRVLRLAGISFIIAGVLTIILAVIVLMMKKPEMEAPAK